MGYVLIKRVFDFFASFVGLILLSPLFLVIAVMIKLDDPAGPVFYSQQRLGRKEREFRMFKFRSMCVDADKKLKELLDKNEVDGAMFKMKEDPRITKIGHFIRRTSIDELPQLLNVFLGDMSLVGPRPPLPREIAQYSDYDRKRLAVKPGCTGLWQVSGRNDVGFKEMVELDIRYIEKRSIFLDLKIIFRTVGIMLRPNGAY
nr:sugar transferase [Lapidilactobacillus luobeiensis]